MGIEWRETMFLQTSFWDTPIGKEMTASQCGATKGKEDVGRN